LVSASAEMKKITNIGSSGSQYQSRKEPGRPSQVPIPVDWLVTIPDRFSVPAHISTVTITKPMETS
jgi:hypothetical protein